MLFYQVVCSGLLPPSFVFRGGDVRFSFFLVAFEFVYCSWLVFLGFSLLVINYYLSKKKKAFKAHWILNARSTDVR